MIFTRIKLDNIFCFNNTEIDFSYPRLNPNSVIEHEYLEGAKNFRFKRLCVISGANASGKSSFARALIFIVNLVHKGRRLVEISNMIPSDQSRPIKIEFEFVHPDIIDLHVFKFLSLEISDGIAAFEYAEAPINANDSVEKCREKINRILLRKKSRGSFIYLNNNDSSDYHSAWKDLEEILQQGLPGTSPFIKMDWNIAISQTSHNPKHSIHEVDHRYKQNLLTVLQTFDPSIVKISETVIKNEEEGEEVEKITGYRIHFKDGKYCDINEDGIANSKYETLLSKGTYQGIFVAAFIHYIITRRENSSTLFLDEMMSNSHTEIEREIVNLIVQITNKYSQFFYTTHNYDVLEMSFPLHSFVFLKKEETGSTFTWADTVCNQNDRSILPYVKANYFETKPATEYIDELLSEFLDG